MVRRWKSLQQSETEKQKVSRIMNRYHRAREERQKYDPKWNELDKFYRGEQYYWEKIPPWVPKPVTNFIHLVVTMKRAALALENGTGMLSAVSREDVERVKELQQIYEWVWKKVKARKAVRDAIETSCLLGTAITHVYWNEHTGVRGGTNAYYEGEIELCEIDPSSFFPDPNADCLEDCEYVHVVERRSRQWIEKTFGVSLKDVHAVDSQDTDIYERERNHNYRGADEETEMYELHTHYERYWNTEKVRKVVPEYEEQPVMIEDPETGEMVPDPSGATETVQVGEREVETDEEVGGWVYRCTYIVGDKILKEVPRLVPNMYPFAILYDYKQRKEFWGKSIASLIIDNQKLINKVESLIAMIGTLLQNPQKVISKKSGINPKEARKYSTAPGHVWVTNERPRDSIAWQEPPQIPQALYNLAEAAKQNIREITGMNEAYMGQAVGSLQTSSGVDALIDRATMRDRDKMYDIELYIEQLSRLIIGFVVHYYTDYRYLKVIHDESNPNDAEFIEFLGTDYQDLEFDFHIDVSGKAPITMLRKQQEAENRLQLQGQYGFNPRIITPQEYIENMDMVGKREILDRMNREEMQSNLQKLQTVLQMCVEAIASGMPFEEVMQMAQQHLTQIESGKAPIDPFNPGNISPQGQAIGSAANNLTGTDNIGQIQMQQAEMAEGEPMD